MDTYKSKAKAAAAMAKLSKKKNDGAGDGINLNLPSMSKEKPRVELNVMGSGGGSKYGVGGEVYGNTNIPVLQKGNTTISAGGHFGFGAYRSSDGSSGFQGGAIPTVSFKKTIGKKNKNQ